MATSSKDLAAKFDKMARTIPDANVRALNQASLAAKETMLAGAMAAGLKPGAPLPHATGKRWGVRYDIKGYQNATSIISFFGKVHWINSGTKDHWVTSKKLGGSRASRGQRAEDGELGKRAGIRTPQGIRSRAHIKGARGRHFWPAVKAKLIAQSPPIFSAAYRSGLIKSGFGK